jgi:hypothetical protein
VIAKVVVSLQEQLGDANRVAKRERIRAERAERELTETHQQLVDLQHGTEYGGVLGEIRYWAEQVTAKTISATRRVRGRLRR